jgi:hypothetical protein
LWNAQRYDARYDRDSRPGCVSQWKSPYFLHNALLRIRRNAILRRVNRCLGAFAYFDLPAPALVL